jgi:molecular chaperone DnaK (HSP70)
MTDTGLVIGIDYGTTYSGAHAFLKASGWITDKPAGVAFCETSGTDLHEQRVEVIHDWPSYHTKIGTKEKVPSEIAYTTEGVRWGSLIRSNVSRHMWTKLQLEGSQVGESAKIQRELESIIEGSSKTPVEIAADFLRQLKDHLIANLDQKYGSELWRTLPITFAVTVPAVWSDAAKDRTLQAFQKAGFDSKELPLLCKQILTTEPEAAAIHTINAMRGTAQDKNLSVGDGFMVCDMGGGTVDLISYRVASLQPTMISEATVGSGAQCGGSFIDREFLKWLEHRLGTTDFVKIAGCRSGDVPRTSLAKKAAQMLQDFTLEAKTCFSGDEPYYLRLPAPLSGIEEDESRGIYDGELQLTP